MQGRRQCSCPPQLIREHYKTLTFWANRTNSKTLKITFKWLDPNPGGGTASPGGSTLYPLVEIYCLGRWAGY